MKTLSIKSKILLFLVPALIYMIGVSGVLVYQNYNVRQNAIQVQFSGSYFRVISGLIHSLQKERAISSGVLTGRIPLKDLQEQRAETDGKINSVFYMLPNITRNISDATETQIKSLNEIRAFIDSNGKASESTKMYSGLIEAFINLQSVRAREFTLNGLEGRLVSQSIFESAKENAGRIRGLVTSILGEDKAITPQDVERINAFRLGISLNLESKGLIISDASRASVQKILASPDWQYVTKTLTNVQARSQVGEYGQDSKEFLAKSTSVIDAIAEVLENESSVLMTDIVATKNAATSAFWLYLLAASLGVFLIALVAYYIMRSTTSILTSLTGDLTSTTSVVASSSKKLSEASASLSSGVAEQAAALQETVASLEQIRAMVGRNADGAKQAQDLALQNSKEVSQGKEAIVKMLSDVHQIAESNQAIERQVAASNMELSGITKIIDEIATKTKVINDIVFQTKLLSFNASVEAARAGEHGKGFAVVAEEVGNLAMMSGNAAKEIVQLLEGSIQKVDGIVAETKTQVTKIIADGKAKIDSGVGTAKQCRAVFDTIADRSDELGKVISEVATASSEQAKGVDEISKAMNQLESVTNTNSSAADQGASVATQLREQSKLIETYVKNLSGLVFGSMAISPVQKVVGAAPVVQKSEQAAAKVIPLVAHTNVVPALNSAIEPKPQVMRPVTAAAPSTPTVVSMVMPTNIKSTQPPIERTKLSASGEMIPSSDDARFVDL